MKRLKQLTLSVVVIALTLLPWLCAPVALLLCEWPDPLSRIILGTITVLSAGWLAGRTLFPAQLSGPDRIIMSVVLAFPVVGGVAILLALTPTGLDQKRAAAALIGEIMILWIGAKWRIMAQGHQSRVPPARRATGGVSSSTWPGLLLAATVISVLGGGLYVVRSPGPGVGYTDLYLVAGESQAARVGVINHENRQLDYRLVAERAGQVTDSIALHLAPGEGWQGDIRTAARPAKGVDVPGIAAQEPAQARLDLYLGSDGLPYRQLWVQLMPANR